MSGSNLIGTTGITVTAPAGYEVGQGVSPGSYSSSTVVAQTSANTVASTTISVRLTGSGSGTVSGNVTNASTSATTQNVAVTGTVSAGGTPTISITGGGSLTAFNTLTGTASTAQSYTVSGSSLTANILITAPSGYEVSQTSATTGFSGTQTLTQSGGTVASTTIYVRLTNAASGTPSGNVTHASTGATTQNVAVTGTVVAEPTTQPTVSAGTPGANTVTLTLSGGNGTKRLLIVRPSANGATAPTDQNTYTANLAYGSGSQLGTNNYVIVSGTATTANVTGLAAGTAYVAEVYSYNEGTVAGFENYLPGSPGSASFTTATAPVTLVNYDFNSGTSYATLAPALASGITSVATATQSFTQNGGVVSGSSAFTTNATAGNDLTLSPSSGTNTNYFEFTLGGANLGNYGDYKLYFQAQRSTTGAQTVTVAYSTDGGSSFTNFGTTVTVTTSFGSVGNVVDLTGVTALNNQTGIIFRLLASAASGSGTLRIDNFQVQAVVNGLTPSTITLTSVSGVTMAAANCLGSGIAVSLGFTSAGASLTGSTQYTAQLSNASGSFSSGTTNLANPTTGAAGSYTINTTIPNTVADGASYRLRIVSTTPTLASNQSSAFQLVSTPTSYTVSVSPGTPQSFCTGASGSAVTASITSLAPSGSTATFGYQWKYGTSVGGPFSTNISGATSATYTPAGADFGGVAGTYYLVAEATPSCGAVVNQSSPITITLLPGVAAANVKQGSTTYPSGGTAYSGFASTVHGGTSAAVTFTIENTGCSTLNLSSLTTTGDFAVSAGPVSSTVAAGASTTFQVTFTPTGTGTRTGTVQIPSNDPATPYVLNLSATGLPNAASDVIFNTGFTYNTTGIDYASATNQLTSITNTSQGTGIYGLTIRDGGASGDADNLPTILSSLTFSSVQGIGSIRAAALFQGNTKVSADANTVINTGTGTIAFNSLSVSVSDNSSLNFSLRVTFNTTATDAQQLRVSLTSANTTAAASGSSTFAGFTTLSSTTTAGSNEINVIADRVRYNPAPPSTAGVNVDLTVGVEAVDANLNRDTDFRGGSAPSVTLTRGAGTGTFTSTTNPTLTKTLTSGVASWTDLRYNVVESGVQLVTTNTGGLTNATATINFVAFAGILWDGGAGTNKWFDANNWSTNAVPTASDDVRLDNSAISGGYTVLIDAAGAVAKSLQVGYSGSSNTITLDLNVVTTSTVLTVGGGSLSALVIEQGGEVLNQVTGSGSTGLNFSSSADTWVMNGNGRFQQNTQNAFPTIAFGKTTFASTSTFEILSVAATNWANGGVARIKRYGNLITANGTTITLASGLNTTDSLIVTGNWSHTGGLVRFVNNSTDQIRVRVKGNLSIGTGATVHVSESGGNSFNELIVEGNVTTTGTGQLGATGSSSTGKVTIGGSFTGSYNAGAVNDDLIFSAVGGNTAASTLTLSGTISVRRLTINKQLILGSNVAPTVNTTVSAIGTLDFNSFNTTGAGSFTLTAGGTLKITDIDGITLAAATPTGNVRGTGARTFPNGAVYWYKGTAAQQTGTGLPTTNGTKTVIADNPTTLTPTASFAIQSSASFANSQPTIQLGTLEIRQGTLLETATAEISGTGNLKMTGGRYWLVKGVASGVPTALPQLSGAYSLTGGSIVLGGANNQSLKGGLSYNKITFATSGTKTLTSSITSLPDTLAVTGAAVLDLTQNSNGVVGTVELRGAGALRMTGTSWLKTSLTSAVSPAPGMQGVYDLTGGTIEFANTSGTIQTIRGNDVNDANRTYNNVWVTGTNVGCSSGNFAVRSGGTFTVKTGADFTITNQAITGAGNFVMEPNTTFQYGSADGITTVAGGGTGTTAGNIRVSGTRTYVSNATYILRGTGNSVTGDGLPSTVTNLTLNKGAAGNEVSLTSALSISGALTFTEGLLALQNASVTIAPGGSISGATSTKYVRTSASPTATGSLIQRVPANATDVVFPVGTSTYTPARLQLTAASTADDFGVRVFDGVYSNGTSGTTISTHVVNRTWDITEAVSGGSDAAVTVQWNSADANITFDRFLCGVSHYLGGGIWDHKLRGWAPATDLGGGVYERSRAGFTSFSPFAVQDGAMVLPVELIAFDAQLAGNKVLLTWATASESDNDRFEILRSVDGRKFTTIGAVKGVGNSQLRHDYEYVDASPLAGTAYYRLRQVDTKGEEQFSPVRVVTRQSVSPSLTVWPNPASDRITLAGAHLAGATVRIIDATGRVVMAQQLLTAEAAVDLEIGFLPTGIYRVQLMPLEGPVMVQPLVKSSR